MGTIKIIEENEKSYTAIADGKKVVLWKIDTAKLEAVWKEKVRQAGNFRNIIAVKEMIDNLMLIQENPLDVNDYEAVVLDICKDIKKFIDSTPPAYNVFHTVYKYLHPECYGKAQTFTKYTDELIDILSEMETTMERSIHND